MAHIIWKHPKPAVNPFEAVAGDLTEYSVHLCEVRDHKDEEGDALIGVVRPALEAARAVTREEARYFLFDFDPVYSVLTLVVTDGDREKDEHHVYKLIFHDWDRVMQQLDVPDAEYEVLCKNAERRMYDLLDLVLRHADLTVLVGEMKERGFEFWFTNSESDSDWEHLDL